jgi:hypothetical protein
MSPNDAVTCAFVRRAVCVLALLAASSLAASWVVGATDTGPSAGQEQARKPPRVTLTIDYGDDVEKRFKALEWRPGLTALDALEQAARHKRGIKLEHRGSGATAFVERIDDLENEGAGGKNWLYQVNGQRAKRGAGALVLEAGDEVLWTFGPMR